MSYLRGDLDRDTICSLSTPQGRSAIAIVRLSGSMSYSILRQLGPQLPENPLSHHVYRCTFNDSVGIIDDGVVLFFAHSKSFTGEQVCEINCHGNPHIVDRIIQELIAHGARLARPGEFTYRAFINGKIDLIQAESILGVIESENILAVRQSALQLKGKLSERIEEIESDIIWCLAHLEASIDFSTEGLDIVSREVLKSKFEMLQSELKNILGTYRAGRVVRNGIRVAIFGRPNVGKSSLFNLLLGETKAIVTHVAGTTRDVLEASWRVSGYQVSLFDTAGVRDTDDIIEQMGVGLAHKTASDADLVLLVIDWSEGIALEDLDVLVELGAERVVVIFNKLDLLGTKRVDEFRSAVDAFVEQKKIFQESADKMSFFKRICIASATQGIGTDVIQEAIKISLSDIDCGQETLLMNLRQFEGLEKGLLSLDKAILAEEENLGAEFVSLDLKEALLSVQETLGKRYDDQVMDRVFKEFCLGK